MLTNHIRRHVMTLDWDLFLAVPDRPPTNILTHALGWIGGQTAGTIANETWTTRTTIAPASCISMPRSPIRRQLGNDLNGSKAERLTAAAHPVF